ncbi:MAG: ATP-dependent DNA helicase [Bacteroidetes bacterium]|nr:ATP-dependent DNA helicase [Bacteroidota bacterium]
MSFNKERLEKKFREEFERLNEQQRLAVEHTEGPVMVIAGPGTGKTQILASRIGKILLDTDCLPENILCLTYTESGAVAMRRRLLQFIGPEAYKVNICTFHAFCNDVIQENLSLFEKTSLDAITDLEKIQLYKELIDAFPKNHPLKRYRGDVYFEVNNLQSLFSSMKREGWTPEYIYTKIDEYLADLPNRDEFIYKRKYKEFNAGDLKKDKIAEENERMEKLRAAVGEFHHFQQLMRKKNRYDFDDMINWVIRAFEENKNLLANYQERYQYILVDEYQDTSGTQNRLVELLISYWEKPNIFVVGDDDQSIYRFQGANVENMLDFAGRYTDDLLTVVLTNNYRSTQPILDISKTLISNNEGRLVKKISGLSKDLTASNTGINHLLHTPVIQEYETQRQEMIGIARSVQVLLGQGVAPGRIGIIYKENKYGDELSRYFKQLNVPVYSRRNLNILELPLAQKIVTVLRYLNAEHDTSYGGDELLFELLHFNWFDIPPVEIAKLSLEAAEKRYSGNKISIRQLLVEKAAQPARDLFTPGIHEGLKKASTVIEELISDVTNLTLQQLFETMIRKAGVLTHIMTSPDKHWQLQVLMAFFEFVKEETHRNPLLTLEQLVTLLDMMEKESIPLPLVQVSGSEKGVNLMTAHGSKGLEFEYVFLSGCNSSFWEKKRKPSGGYKLPDTIFTSQAANASEGEGLEELRRLFYVGITRAEQHLYISYAKFKNDGKELEPSMFIAEIQDAHALVAEKIFIDPDVLTTFSTLQFTAEQAPEIEKLEEEYLRPILDKFVMNVTALNNYLKCPLEFYFKQLIRIPAPKNEATEFGSAVHHALEKLFRKMLTESTAPDGKKGKFDTKESFIADFEWYMIRHRESFTREQFERRMEYGREVLGNYYDKYIGQFNTIVTIERNIRNVVIKGVPLKGKLDKLEFDGKQVNVVDYKTGDIDKALPKTKGPSEKDPNGGDYWRQAVFYKLLVDNYEQKGWKAVSTEFDFIEPDKKKNYRKEKIIITPADITTVSQQIADTWQKIQNREFYTGCGKEDCHWCNFIKTNDLAVDLHTIEEDSPND